MSRVKGHALRWEGAPHVISETGPVRITPYLNSYGTAGVGRGLCECGAMSDIVDSAGKRKKWHRAHKAEVTA